MKHVYRQWVAIFFLVVLVPFHNASGQAKKNIVILATGGTIAGAAATGTQAGYTSGQVGINTMINAVPGIKDLANLKGEQVANVGSQDMSFDIMLTVAKRINALAAKPDVDGIVSRCRDQLEQDLHEMRATGS